MVLKGWETVASPGVPAPTMSHEHTASQLVPTRNTLLSNPIQIKSPTLLLYNNLDCIFVRIEYHFNYSSLTETPSCGSIEEIHIFK